MLAWLRQPLTFRRRGALLIGALIGTACGVAIILGSSAVSDLRIERHRAIDQERAARRLNDAAVARIARLEKPTPAELDAAFKARLLRCLHSRRCVLIVRKVIHHARPLDELRLELQRDGGPSSSPSVGGGSSGPQSRPPAPTTQGPRHGGGGPHGGGGGSSGPSSPSSPQGPPSSSPAPRPPVDVQVPGIPPVCTPLVGVNC